MRGERKRKEEIRLCFVNIFFSRDSRAESPVMGGEREKGIGERQGIDKMEIGREEETV